jgi:mono/diheme cytochrome c family protein
LLAGCGHDRNAAGRAIFRHSCAGCHTLTGHDTNADGGDLAIGNYGAADVASFARVMPVRPKLTGAQVQAVARYVESRGRAFHG